MSPLPLLLSEYCATPGGLQRQKGTGKPHTLSQTGKAPLAFKIFPLVYQILIFPLPPHTLMPCVSLQQHLQDTSIMSQKVAASGVLFSPSFPSLRRLSASITIHWKLPRPAVIGKTTPALRDEYNRSRAAYSSVQERQ